MIDRILPALEMMGQGMAGIFVVLGLIALIVAGMQKLDSGAGHRDKRD